MLKPEENPPIIWPPDTSIKDFQGTWWVVHTKSRNEKALAWQMQRKNINYFLPMTEKVYRKSRRVIRSLLPLFSGYVFFCGDEPQRLEILKTNRAAGLLAVKDQQHFIAELLPIEKALTSGLNLAPYHYLKAGQLCKVIAGPLMGIEGLVVSEHNKTRLVLQVDVLGKATCLEIDSALLEIVPENSI
ncbi:MAG: transcription termination/antitermination NusG family protein [Phycisphaerae bacterium]|jgi:transcriptional antiterminator RfaH